MPRAARLDAREGYEAGQPTLAERAAAVRDRLLTPEALGLVGFRRSGSGWLGRCPLHEDGSPSFSLRAYADGVGWTCFAGCGKGDALALVARMHGLSTRGADFARVVEVGERLAGIMPGEAPRPVAVRRVERERVLLDPDEVAALWASCIPADEDDEVAAWIRSRGLDVAHVVDRELARALPKDARMPRWAWTYGAPWTATGHRLVVPTYDATGRICSCQARAIVDHTAKAVWPRRPTPETLVALGVFADPLGRLLLESGEAPDWWQGPVAIEVVEGIPDFLNVATLYGDDESAPAVLGFAAGAWTEAIAGRVPTGSVVTLYQHGDRSGDTYTENIAGTLAERVEVNVVRIGDEDE